MTLPTDAAARKHIPIASGFIDYFPDAIAEVADLSKAGNDQHNPGKPLHWDRSKSGDEDDALARHFVERGTRDSDGKRHRAKVAWRALASLQKEIEYDRLTTDDERRAWLAANGNVLPKGCKPPAAAPRSSSHTFVPDGVPGWSRCTGCGLTLRDETVDKYRGLPCSRVSHRS
jgi:hypothetical protein